MKELLRKLKEIGIYIKNGAKNMKRFDLLGGGADF